MRTAAAILIFLFTFALPARADYTDEHPELFGITSPPAGVVLTDNFSPPGAFMLRPAANAIHSKLLYYLQDTGIVVLHAGEAEKADIESFLAENDLAPPDIQFVDLEELDTTLVGEYSPLAVKRDGGLVMVDPRYYPNRPHDDAAGSKLATGFSTCAYRPPMFMTRGFVDTDGKGFCIMSSKLFYSSPGLTDQELKGQLLAYLGCDDIVSLQALQSDGEGRLTTFARFALPGKVLFGQYEISQESLNISTLKGNRDKLLANLPEGTQLQEMPMATPVQIGSSVLRPSYLSFIVAKEKILVPVFEDDTEFEGEALSILTQTFATHELVPVESGALVQSGSRLTSEVAAIPDVDWDTGCTPPDLLCESASPMNCDLCYDECKSGQKECVSPTSTGVCVAGEDGCLDLEVTSCPAEYTCENAKCKAPPTVCDTMPEGGICEGDVMKKCVGDQLITLDCTEQNKFCSVDDDGNASCIVPCYVSCEPGEQTCSEEGNEVLTCVEDPDGCPALEAAPCPAGTLCQDGQCVEAGDDVTSSAEPDEDADQRSQSDTAVADWGAGYKGGNNCCSFSPPGCGPRPGNRLALLACIAVMLFVQRVRKRNVPNQRG